LDGGPAEVLGQTIHPHPCRGLHLGETISKEFGDNDHQPSISAMSNDFPADDPSDPSLRQTR